MEGKGEIRGDKNRKGNIQKCKRAVYWIYNLVHELRIGDRELYFKSGR